MPAHEPHEDRVKCAEHKAVDGGIKLHASCDDFSCHVLSQDRCFVTLSEWLGFVSRPATRWMGIMICEWSEWLRPGPVCLLTYAIVLWPGLGNASSAPDQER